MTTSGPTWLPRLGWAIAAIAFVVFIWGLDRRTRLEAKGDEVLRMLFVPSVEQGTLVERADELARFIRQDSGLVLQTEVPTSYAAVIQALGAEQADVAWMPAFAYVIAHGRYRAEARLQVVRSAERDGIVVTRSGEGEPSELADLAGRGVAFPPTVRGEMREKLVVALDQEAAGWTEVAAESDKDAVRRLVENPFEVAAAASTHVFSGPYDLIGDGRKELEYDLPGTLERTRVIHTTDEPVQDLDTVYRGCVLARTDSGIRRLQDLTGRSFAFSDETSTSGHIFPRMLLDRNKVALGRVYFAGGHPNVVQAVWDGKAIAGSTFYSPPGIKQREEALYVGDARYIIMRRFATDEERQEFLRTMRIIALTDPIPNDLCAVRKGFSEEIWQRFLASFQRYLQTPEGSDVFNALLTAVGVAEIDDSAFDGFRAALEASGMSAEGLMEAAEEKLEKQKQGS
ncbi:MAG: PhnD/SsuA/transferrin family substrate-binding protein [Thermoanaerobaculia bacterium]